MVEECARLRIADELRPLRAEARRQLGSPRVRPSEAAVGRLVAERLAGRLDVVPVPTPFGTRWAYSCGSCARPAFTLLRPPGALTFTCGRCCRAVTVRLDRGWSRFSVRLPATLAELATYRGRRGRPPRRAHRLVAEALTLLDEIKPAFFRARRRGGPKAVVDLAWQMQAIREIILGRTS